MPDWVLSKRSRSSHFQNRSCVETDHESSSLTTTALVAVAAYAGYIFHRSVQKHGWEGALRLVWEGDPYEPLLRDAVDTLEESEWNLRATHRIDDRLTGLEESLDAVRAIASSNSNASSDAMDVLWNQAWMEHPANRLSSNDDNPLTIEHTLADMSDKLDKIAARVDGVILSSASSSCSGDKASKSCTSTSNTFLLQRVKARKKQLSMGIVSDMERCDALMASYQVLRERRSE